MAGPSGPDDRYHMTYWLLYLQGVGTLLPWNMFITAVTYFQYKFGTDHGAAGEHKADFENYFEVVSMVPNIMFLFLNMLFKHLIGLQKRLVVSISIMFLAFVVTCILIYVDTFSWQNGFFAVTLIIAFCVNAASASYQSGLYGMAAFLSEGKYTQAIMGGQGFSGLFSAVANIIALSAGSAVQPMALGYFLSATVVLALCLVAVILMPRLTFVSYHLSRHEGGGKASDGEINSINESGYDGDDDASDTQALTGGADAKVADAKKMPNFWVIIRKIYHLALSVAGIFFVTLAVFPAVSQSVASVAARHANVKLNVWQDKYFVSLTTFLLFNAGDYAGRTAAGMVQLLGPRSICIISFLRLGFLPLFALCNAYPDDRTMSVVFDSDVYPVLFMSLLALSNGYISSLCMMTAPGLVEPHERETTGTMMAFCLGAGLTAGAGFSFAMKAIIT
ncbi:equilibrative nucleoside transporter 3-like [Sycon ciliatum]|uniref:equilibrative nucleoside transporter 3-like n=1 Tax=Sycon ciliatum TaxID=27933 RepID=UPI0031F6E581